MYQRIAILFAVEQERAPLARRLPLPNPRPDLRDRRIFWISEVEGRHILLLAGGVGHRKAEEAARRVVEHWVPDLLVMAGVAGALSPELVVGDVVVADRIVTREGVLEPPVILDPAETAVRKIRVAALVSQDQVVVTAKQKELARTTFNREPVGMEPGLGSIRPAREINPIAVEMETAGLIKVARESSIPWAAVRTVSDTAREDLPLDFNRLRSKDGDLPISRVALAAMTHPWAIPGLIRLGRNTGVAADALAAFLLAWIHRGLPVR